MKRLFSAALALLLVSLFPLSAAAAPKAIADKVYRPALRIEKKAEGNVISLAWEAEGQIVSTKVTRVSRIPPAGREDDGMSSCQWGRDTAYRHCWNWITACGKLPIR